MTTERVAGMMLGEVEILRVVEWTGPFLPARGLVPGSRAEQWQENADWLAPDHWDPRTDEAKGTLQSWVLRSAGRTVLVDTGVGNGRERPSSPMFHMREGDYLARLAAVGIRPEEVDVVVNTHLHADHVGWNTRAVDGQPGEWVPTFPNARYLLPAPDDSYYGPAGGYAGGLREDDRLLYEDSIEPVRRAGQLELWEGGLRIDENLSLEPAPGHSPGSSVLRLASGTDRAVFVGDLMHSPVQVLTPAHNSCFCQDPAQAAASRLRVLERAADQRELVVPAHFSGTGALEVRRDGPGGFAVTRWRS